MILNNQIYVAYAQSNRDDEYMVVNFRNKVNSVQFIQLIEKYNIYKTRIPMEKKI